MRQRRDLGAQFRLRYVEPFGLAMGGRIEASELSGKIK
jgi:hypothetical protein